MSLEEAAREVRYRFLANVAEQVGAEAVVLGHTSDDQVETVLMNVIRGSGLRGLRGMMPVSKQRIAGSDLTLFRPLLNLPKQDTIAYCEALHLTPRADESNRSMEMTRNRIRLELLPLLRDMNPAFGDAALRLSRNAVDALAVVDKAVDEAWSDAVTEEGESIRIDRERFFELDAALRSHLVIRALSHVKGDTQGIERIHVDDAVNAVIESSGSQLHLPGGLRLIVEQRSAHLYAEDDVFASSSFDASPLAVPGLKTVGGWRISTERIKIASEDRSSGTYWHSAEQFVERFGRGVDVSSLAVRSRVPGDRFQPLGMSGTKKLKDFMIDEKVPGSMRDGVPLIVTSRGIAWVVGWRIAEWAKVDDDHECLEIRVERIG